jgi:uncharacterized protein (TIGR02099 family)
MWIKYLARIFQWIWWIAGSFVIAIVLLLAVILNVARLSTPWLNHHPELLQKKIEEVVPYKLQFKSMDLSWSWLSPKVVLSDVTISMPAQKNRPIPATLHMNALSLSLNLLQTLWDAHVQFNALNVEGAHMTVHEFVDGYGVNGLFIPKNKSETPMTLHSIALAFSSLKISRVQLDTIDVVFEPMHHDPITMQLQNMTLEQSAHHYRLHGLMSVGPDQINLLQFWMNGNDAEGLGNICLQISNLHIQHLKQWPFLAAAFNKIDAAWQELLKLNTHVDATVWIEFAKNSITKIQSKLTLNQIQIEDPSLDQENILMSSLSANLAMVHAKSQWTITADQVIGIKNNIEYPLGDFLIRCCGGGLGKNQWTVYTNHFNLALFSQKLWVNFLSQFPRLKSWAGLDPHGFIDFMHLDFVLDKDKTLSSAHFQVQAFLHQVGWQAVGHVPLVSHLDGVIEADETTGVIRLKQQLGALNFEGIFKYPFDRLDSHFDGSWVYDPKESSWKFHLDQFSVNDGHLNVQTQGVLVGHGFHAPQANLYGNFSLDKVERINHYLPLVKLSPKLYDWLTAALQQGSLVNGELSIQGPTEFFPFKKNEGIFIASGDLQKVSLKFDPAWPSLNDLQAHLVFQNNGMQCDQASATLFGLQASHMQAAIPSFSDAHVEVSSEVSGELKNLTDFVLNTPLSVAEVFKSLKGEGGFNGSLHLDLPIKNLKKSVRVDGFVSMQDATWQAPAWNTVMTHTHGTVQFSQLGVSTDDVVGMLFGSPTQIMIKSEMEPGFSSPVVGVQLSGDYALPVLAKAYVPMLEPFVAGHSPFVMDLTVYGADAHKDDVLNLYSNLDRAEILHLPDGLGKLADEKRDLQVMMQINDTRTLINTDYNHTIKSQSVLTMHDGQQSLVSTQVTLGDAVVPEDEKQGLAIAVSAQHSDLDAWYQTYTQYIKNRVNSDQNSMMLHYFSARIQSASVLNQDLSDVHAVVKKSDDEWDWRVASSRVNGDGIVPIHDNGNPWVIRLKNANLKSVQASKAWFSNQEIRSSDFPAMNLSIENFSYDHYQLHQLSFELSHPNEDQLFLDHIMVGDSTLNLTAKLHGMDLDTTQPYWQLDGSLQGTDFGTGLAELGLPVHLINTSGQMKISSQIDHRWPVGHWKDMMNLITANIDISLQNGTVIGLSPSVQSTLGNLKLLNTLSILTLPEKFSGSGPGNLYFTKILGTASLKNSQWQVPQVTLNSSELSAQGSGFGKFSDRSVNFWVKVQPHLTGSVPVIAAFAGGPVVGVASWLVDKLFVNPVLGNATTKTFHIQGQWPNLDVATLNSNGS